MRNRAVLPIIMITIFGIAVALFEAIVDYYLNRIAPTGTIISLPLVPKFHYNMLLIEQTREIAVVVLLAFTALLFTGNRWRKLAAFIWLFGIWTLFSRLSLWIMPGFESDKSSFIFSAIAPMQSCFPVWMIISASLIMLICAVIIYMKKSQAQNIEVSVNPKKLLIKLLLLTIFSIAMAHLEGAVVVYIRALLVQYTPDLDGFQSFNAPAWLIAIERLREMCTIVMLIAIAMLAGKSKWEKFAVFIWAFAVWDIFYYVSLKVCTGWPESLATLDVLFLIPVVWVEPVWFPVSASFLMLVFSFFIFRKQAKLD